MFYPKTSRDGDAGDCRAYPLNHWCWISCGSMLDSRACLVQSVERLSCHMLWGSRMPDLGLESHQCLCCTRDESEGPITYRWWSTQVRESNLALKPWADLTRSSKQGYRGPTKRTRVLQFLNFCSKKGYRLVCLAVIFFLTGSVFQQSLYRYIIVNAEFYWRRLTSSFQILPCKVISLANSYAYICR